MLEKRVLILILLLSSNLILSGQEVIKLESKVISASVFTETATVTREAKVNLQSTGEYVLVFSNITSDFPEQSVKVSGKGTAKVKILDVKTEEKYTNAINNEQLKKEQNKIDSLILLDQISSDKITVLESQKSYIESIKSECAKEINEKIASSKANINEWQSKYEFFNKNLTDTYNELRSENLKRKKIIDQINEIKENTDNITTGHDKRYKEIQVKVLSEQPGSLTLQASYSVYEASWQPVYDARIFTENKNLELSYFGMVKQNTGEDWKNIKLTLSTAKPLTNESMPELSPLYVNVDNNRIKARTIPKINTSETKTGYVSNPKYKFDANLQAGFGSVEGKVFDSEVGEPLIGANLLIRGTSIGAAADFDGFYKIRSIPAGKYKVVCSYIGYKTLETQIMVRDRETLTLDFYLGSEAMVSQAIEITAQAEGQLAAINKQLSKSDSDQEIKYEDVKVNTKETFSTYEINSRANIPGDNLPHKIHVTTQPMDISLEYKSIPKLSPNTYLICKAANKKDFAFAAGEINLFLEDEFITKSNLPNIAPGDTFDISTGTDEGIKTERKLINRFTESTGLINGKKRITYEYEITTVNNKAREQKIIIQDQLPISQNENIIVEVLDPNEKELDIDNQKIITWKVELKPGEKKIIPLKYRVTFPEYSNVIGLE